MKIGIYLGLDTAPTDNITELLLGVARALSEHKIEVFGRAPLPNSVKDHYTQVQTSPRSPRTPYTKILATYFNCIEYIRQQSPDIIFQIWKYQTHAPGIALAGYRTNVPTITRFAGDIFNESKSFSQPKKLGVDLLTNYFGRIPLYFADSMIVLGPYGAAQVSSHGIEDDDITIVPPPGDLDQRFSPPNNKEKIKEKLDLSTNGKIILYVGRLSKLKGMKFLTDVITQVRGKIDSQFVLVGGGSYRNKFERRFSESVLRLPGHVPHDQIHLYYQASDIYIHPSPYEGIPLVILEALNSGVPVVSRPAGDIGFVTPNITETPSEMANRILTDDYTNNWLNRRYFTDKYQKEALNKIVRSIV